MLLTRPAGGRVRSIAMSMSVCLSVRSPISETTRLNFTDMQVACGRGSVLSWRLCETTCTSGFVDNVVLSRNGCMAIECHKHDRRDSDRSLLDDYSSTSCARGGEVCYLLLACCVADASAASIHFIAAHACRTSLHHFAPNSNFNSSTFTNVVVCCSGGSRNWLWGMIPFLHLPICPFTALPATPRASGTRSPYAFYAFRVKNYIITFCNILPNIVQ